MTASTFEPAPLWQRILPFAVVLGAVLGLSWLTDRLYFGTAVYFIGGAIINILRAIITRGRPLDVVSRRQEGVQKVFLALVTFGGFVLPVMFMVTLWIDFARYQMPLGVQLVGAVILIVSAWLFWRSHMDLGEFWSPVLEMREGHKLVTNGIYRSIRHPMYTSIFAMFVSQSLLVENWVAGPAGVIIFCLLFFQRVGPEEAMMEDQFGDAWRAYKARTGRLWPRLR